MSTPESQQIETTAFAAFEAQMQAGLPASDYKITTSDKGDHWRVLILRKGRVRGGGGDVEVSKSEPPEIRVLLLQ
jgi:hypothetical protein